MIEFNSDGSIKLPRNLAKNQEENEHKLRNRACIKIEREQICLEAPKKCILHITLSTAITDNRFIRTIYDYFKDKASVPTELIKINEKEFEVKIGTDFRRCSDCNSLVNRYREFLEGEIIEKKGNCTFKGRNNFCYEDYF